MQKPSPDRPILKKGHNCWRIAPAKRAVVLIDGANYYAQLDKVIRGAQKSILIIGWDFDAGVKLLPEQPDYPKLGDLLRSLVEERPLLEVRVLVWSVALLHAPSAPLPLLLGAPWETIRAHRSGSTASIRFMAPIIRKSSASTTPLPSWAAWT